MFKSISKPAMGLNQIYSIDGNIGCGKSMILEYISSKQLQHISCMQEPVAEWTNMKSGTDLLGSFYNDKERWSFCFENLVQLSRLKAHYQAIKLTQTASHQHKFSKIFLERSIYSSFHVFTENTYEDYGLNKVEYDILKQYFRFFTSDLHKHENPKLQKDMGTFNLPFKLIYIRSDPEVCYERCQIRHRDSEASIDLGYLKNIHFKYEKWVNNLNSDCVHIVDGNQDKVQVLKQVDELINC